jgi:hypothetical protein
MAIPSSVMQAIGALPGIETGLPPKSKAMLARIRVI